MLDICFLIYGILLIVGGFIGYKKAGSKPSLVMGFFSGITVLVGTSFIVSNPVKGFTIILMMSGLLVVTFTIRLIKTKKMMPSGMLLILSLLASVCSLMQLI